jgi:hypothetical protein
MNSSQKMGVIIKARKPRSTGYPCVIDIADSAVPVENSVNKPNTAPATGMNMIRHSPKLLTKMTPVNEAKSLFSVIVLFTWSEIDLASIALNGTSVPAKVATIVRIKMKINE